MTHHHATRALIARADLVDGAYYEGHCRNAKVARWDQARGRFVHWRTKFDVTFLETIKHPEDEDHFDVFCPWRRLDEAEVAKPIPLDNVWRSR